MKKIFVHGGLALFIGLVGCQAADEGAQQDNTTRGTTPGFEQTGYHNNMKNFDAEDRYRNYTLQREADWNQNRDTRLNNNNNNNIDQTRNQVDDNQNENRYRVAEEAAERITDQVDEIDSAYVLTTDNNAYVAAELNTSKRNQGNRNNQDRFDDEISDEVKEEIADIVQSVDNNIENVYVSTNPDFFDLTNNYVDDVNRGEPIEGFFDQFSNMVERIFPQNQ